MMMESTFEVSVDGKKVFTWTGDQEAVRLILEDLPRAAEHAGMAERQFADNCLYHLIEKRGVVPGKLADQEMQMMAVIWRILVHETGNPDHPGKVASYIGAADFAADLHMTKVKGGSKVEFSLIATPHEAGTA